MARRSRGLMAELAEVPWWVGVLAGVVGFVVIAHGLPLIRIDNLYLRELPAALSPLAPIWLIACLLGSALSLLRTAYRQSLYRRQQRAPSPNAISWQDFERLVGEHFRRQGFTVGERGGRGADGGVDLILRRGAERHLVQCKRWRSKPVGVGVVRELIGSITHEGADGGFLVASGPVTEAARDLAYKAGIELIDGQRLCRELEDAPPAETTPHEQQEPTEAATTTCPKCDSPMRLRTARRGVHSGSQFWGCTDFPRCRGTRPLDKGSAVDGSMAARPETMENS